MIGEQAMVGERRSDSIHLPVMLTEVLDALQAKSGGQFLDCTFGGGGHTRAILDAHQDNTVVAIDRDERAIGRAEKLTEIYQSRFSIQHFRFSDIGQEFGDKKFKGIIADLGCSTDQITEARGFSFRDQALDMRMSETDTLSADQIVNQSELPELQRLLRRGGVGAEAREIARAIIAARPIKTAQDLARIIERTHFAKVTKKRIHPATVTFQAIRMQVNDELAEIESLLKAAPTISQSGGRLAVITFHSLEDRAVTKEMRSWSGSESTPALWPGRELGQRLGKMVTKKAIVPSDEEINSNPSARSARLRVFEFH